MTGVQTCALPIYMEAVRDIQWIGEGKTDDKGNVVEKEGPD